MIADGATFGCEMEKIMQLIRLGRKITLYFTDLLIQKTKDTYLAYTKRSLNPVYLQDTVKSKIIDAMFPLSF